MSKLKAKPEEATKLATFKNVSTKIRYLHSKGYSRSDIASILGIRYQWVRNVLITEVGKPNETF